MLRNRHHHRLLAGLLALLPACGSDPAPQAKTAEGQAPSPVAAAAPKTTAAATQRADTKSPTSGSVQIEDRILKACGDVPAARFAFDSTSIEGDAAVTLQALAKCFDTGPLKGKGMRLVGHADARGEPGYNRALGQQRASSVASYVESKGIAASRVSTMSKGELEATGTDEEGWARDRKVEIFLAD
jgi:peptidoglycan-associated lipoprotein